MVRVRYAPSPTGFLHIGNARTALFNYLFAKSKGGQFIIRIEDTDIERNVAGGEESQLKYLKWLGIEWDESVDIGGPFGPYRQMERLDIYQKYAQELIDKGLAYKCFCTPEELEAERAEQERLGVDRIHYSRKCIHNQDQDKPYAVRLFVPANEEYNFNDMVKGNVSFQSNEIGDWVIIKQNGIPTYNFAVVVDDHLMEITHVLRGEDHITNTPKQIGVYKSLGWDIPEFGHMTLIVNENGKKLSKRDESIIQFISQYADLGYLPDALFNFIGLLGWSPESSKEIMSIEEFIQEFDERRLSKSPASFDKAKLAYINNRYIKELEMEDFVELIKPHLIKEGVIEEDEFYDKIAALFKDRMSFGSEIIDLYDEFIDNEFNIESEGLELIQTEGVKATIEAFKEGLQGIEFTEENIKVAMKEAGIKTNAKGKMLFMPCRIATTGMMHGPDLPKLLELLGQEIVIERIEETLKTI